MTLFIVLAVIASLLCLIIGLKYKAKTWFLVGMLPAVFMLGYYWHDRMPITNTTWLIFLVLFFAQFVCFTVETIPEKKRTT